jgi:hypothetical protein
MAKPNPVDVSTDEAIARHKDGLKALLSRTVGEGIYFASQLVVAVSALGAGTSAINSILNSETLDPSVSTPVAMAVAGAGVASLYLLKSLRDKIIGLTSPITHNLNKISNERLLQNFEDLDKSPNKGVYRQRLVDAILSKTDDSRVSELLAFLKRDNVKANNEFIDMLKRSIEERITDSVVSIKSGRKPDVNQQSSSKLDSLLNKVGLDANEVNGEALNQVYETVQGAQSNLGADGTVRMMAHAFVDSLSGSPHDIVQNIKAMRRTLDPELFEKLVEEVAMLDSAGQREVERVHAQGQQAGVSIAPLKSSM